MRPSIATIIVTACEVVGVSTTEIMGPRRFASLIHARAVAAASMRHWRGMSWEEVGRALRRAHPGMLLLVRDRMEREAFRRDVAAVSARLAERYDAAREDWR